MAKGFVSIKAIVPKAGKLKGFDVRIIERNIHDAFEDGALKVQEDFHKTVETWETAVAFPITFPNKETAEIKVKPGHPAKIYGYVDQGTKPHIIRARAASYLRIPSFFIPKTYPGTLRAIKGGRSDSATFRKEVHHPGSKPRKFTKMIAKKWKKSWPKLFKRYLKKR